MSAEIWINIQKAVKEVRPDLLSQFDVCRDRDSICYFLNTYFPIFSDIEGINSGDWNTCLMTQVPDMLRKMKK